jgi:hypothetical protein
MVAIDNPGSEMADLMRRVRFLETQSGADGSGFGDGTHPGSGDLSVQVGPSANAAGESSASLGDSAWATGARSTAAGFNTFASGDDATAVGSSASAEHDNSGAFGKNAMTSAAWQIMLGTVSHTVVVPGTFSNPSARRLKQNIIAAPRLVSVFPEVFEWEYIEGDGRRQIGPMADDLVGTDAERFLVLDDEGKPAGIDKLGLHTAQITVLLARIERLEEELRARNG